MLASTLPVTHHHIPELLNLQQNCCDENLKSCMFCALFLWITPPVSYPLLIVISSLFPVLPTVLKLKDILHKWLLVFGLYSCLHFGRLSCNFRVCKSVHHHTFKWINQPDTTIFQVYYLSFKYSSTCFGHPHARHQELNNSSSSLCFTVGTWW